MFFLVVKHYICRNTITTYSEVYVMGFFSSKIELNNTIKTLEAEIEKLKSEITDKSEQITELSKKVSLLSQKNSEYENKYINTEAECDFCYTTVQKDFAFCPKCGKKIEKAFATAVQNNSSTSIFQTEQDLDSLLINQYNGFNDKKIVIPSSMNGKPVIGIWNGVFEKCVDLEEVIFEEGCKYIGGSAFLGCKNLKKVHLPKSLVEIGSNAFAECTALEEVAIPPKVKTIGMYAFLGCVKLKNVILPENLKCINTSSFENTGIESINIPQSVLHIEDSAFSGTKLKEVDLPHNLYSIGQNAFRILGLTKIIIHSNVEIMEKEIFGRFQKPTVYCAAGSKALLYARKYGLDCVQIPSQPPAHREIALRYLWLKLDNERDLSTLQKRLGVYKASTSAWQCRIGCLMTNQSIDVNDAKHLEELFIQKILRYSYKPSEYSQRIERGTYWGKSEV